MYDFSLKSFDIMSSYNWLSFNFSKYAFLLFPSTLFQYVIHVIVSVLCVCIALFVWMVFIVVLVVYLFSTL